MFMALPLRARFLAQLQVQACQTSHFPSSFFRDKILVSKEHSRYLSMPSASYRYSTSGKYNPKILKM